MPLWGFVFKGIPFYYVGKLVIILYLINPVYNGAGHIASLLLPLFSKAWALMGSMTRPTLPDGGEACDASLSLRCRSGRRTSSATTSGWRSSWPTTSSTRAP